MAETIRIEIPVSVVDNTGNGSASVTRNLTAIERAFQRVERGARGVQSMSRSAIEVGVRADDEATPVLHSVEDTAERVSGVTADVEVSADDSATQIVQGASDAVNNFDGESGQAEITADDGATPVVRGAQDSVENFDGESGTAEIGANDNASQIISSVADLIESLDGMTATLKIQAENNVPDIESGGGNNRASPLGFASGVVNAVTSPIGKAAGMLGNPIAQGAGLLGVSLGVADSINSYKDFEAMMSQVKAISGATGSEFDALTAKAQEMGASTKFTATESAEAFNYMAMAGWKTEDMMGGIEGIMSLAAASGESLGSTSDIVTDALTAFGLKASDSGHFADVLAQASANANTNVGMLGESFKYVAPVAGAMNYSVEDTSLALGLMANASIKGSMAGTALKTSLANMASPTDSMAVAMEKYGISLTDAEGNMKPLKGVMDNLRSSLGGLSETEQTAAASTIFGKEAMAGMLAIINASESDYDKLTKAVYNADGAAKQMSDTMLDNLTGSMTLMQSAVEGVQNSLGQRLAPYLRGAVDGITEAMPEAQAALTKFMDFVDVKAETVGAKISAMTGSQEWANAGVVGKIDIAWNTLIAEPFMDWAGGEGAHMVTTGIGKLFTNASKIFTGGGGLSSWLSAGIIAKGATTTATGIMKLTESLGGLSSMGGKIGFTAAVITAGIAAVGVAIDAYNQKQISNSLEEHFGKIELSARQVKDFTDQLIDAEFTANIHMALGSMNGADEARKEAEEALAANDALEWKCSVGMILSEDEKESYAANVQTFIDSKKTELEDQFSGVTLAINTVIDDENSSHMISTVEEWFAQDQAELDNLSSRLSKAVSSALEDGIIDADEQGAINALQNKINGILASWNESKSQTQLDMIQQKYGHLTGKDLTSGTFQEIIDSYSEQRETQQAELDALSEQYYDAINSAQNSGRLSADQAEEWKSQWQQGILGKQGSSLINAVGFEGNTLRDTYGDEINGNLESSSKAVSRGIENQMNRLSFDQENFDITAFQDYLNAGVLNQTGNASGALKGLYKSMDSDVDAMQDLVDRYRTEFGYIPENLKTAYDEAMQIGAASGNSDAAMQVYAKSLLEQGSDELVSALTDPSNPLYESIKAASPELYDAIQRELAETGKPIELDDLMARLNGIDLENDAEARKALEDSIEEFTQSVSQSGSGAIEVTTEGVQVTLGEVEVDGQSAIEQIASAVNMTADELAIANGYESAVDVPVGATITVPADQINFDTSALQSATQEVADGTEATPVNMEADATIKAGEVDDSAARSEMESQTQETMAEPFPTDGETDVTLTQTNNAAEIYGEVDGEVKDTFAAGFSATAPVWVTLDWKLLNPTANISVSGSGSGKGSVSASFYADGGILENPHIGVVAEDGPEAIIPLGSKRHERGMELWLQAGRALGVKPYADGGFAGKIPTDTGESSSGSGGKDGKKVDIVINLNPTFTVNEGGNGNDTAKSIKDKLNELVNEAADEIAVRLADIFSNMPITT